MKILYLKNLIFIIFILFSLVEAKENKISSKDQNSENNNIRKSPGFIGLGLAGLISPVPYTGTSASILPIPVIIYQGSKLMVRGPYLKYNILNYYSQTSLQLFLYPRTFRASDSSDPKIKKLNNRNYIIMSGINQKLICDFGIVNISINADITFRSKGFNVVSRYSFPITVKKLILTPGIGIEYSSRLLTDYFYGISFTESNKSKLKSYNPGGAFSSFLESSVTYIFSKNFNVLWISSLTHFSNNISNSPMVSKSFVFTNYFSIVYSF